jgi:hypothetical protein
LRHAFFLEKRHLTPIIRDVLCPKVKTKTPHPLPSLTLQSIANSGLTRPAATTCHRLFLGLTSLIVESLCVGAYTLPNWPISIRTPRATTAPAIATSMVLPIFQRRRSVIWPARGSGRRWRKQRGQVWSRHPPTSWVWSSLRTPWGRLTAIRL